jgi:ABC-type sugar transport system ATPase subunit
MENQCFLNVRGVCKTFGGTMALNNARLELRKGEVHALVGANGAGKSTLIKILTGAHSCDRGEIFLDGNKIEIHSPHDAQKYGISAVYQEFSLISNLTVAENIFLGRLPVNKKIWPKTIQWGEIYRNASEILNQMDSYIDPKTLVGDLSVAQKQLVEIAKALSNHSQILIMDEPTSALTDNDIDNLFKVIKGLTAKGISVIYISHRLEELPIITDRVTVFRDGQYVTTLEIKNAPKETIIEHMVGSGLTHVPKSTVSTKEVLMEIKKFTSEKHFYDVSFRLYKGEILGIAGLAGAGRTELVRALFGVDRFQKGEVWIKGKKAKIHSPRDAKRMGIGFVTEDRKEEGLVFGLDIKSNITLTVLKAMTRFIMIQKKSEQKVAEKFVESLSIKTTGLSQIAKNLSGGNQQKLIIAKWLAIKPAILIMDEPTRGIDVGSKGQIYGILSNLAEQGLGIIMISSEIPEILEMSDRILVMAEGKITAELSRKEATQDKILHYATVNA